MILKIIIYCGLITASFGNDSIEAYEESDIESSIETRITGGKSCEVDILEKFKYQVGIIIIRSTQGRAFCGGALIHPEVVLTAAHCALGAKYLAVFMGTYLKQTNPTAATNIIVKPENIAVHQKYQRTPNRNDIALLMLPQPVQLGKYIGVIPLASKKQFDCSTGKAWVSGWGKTNNSEKSSATILQYLNVTQMTNEECQANYRQFCPKQHLCTTGIESTGVCPGDSGGPYVVEDNNEERYLCGLNAFIIGTDCINNKPKYYTSILHHHDNGWICRNSRNLVGCRNLKRKIKLSKFEI